VRCPGLRDPAQARTEDVRGPLAGRGPRQVQVVHDPGAGRQLPRRAGPHGPQGLAFAPETGEPESWAAPGPEPVTWYRHAVAYAEMKWPHLAPHSRASLAD